MTPVATPSAPAVLDVDFSPAMVIAELGVAGSADVTVIRTSVPGVSPATLNVNGAPTVGFVALTVEVTAGGAGGLGVAVSVGVGVAVTVGVAVCVGVVVLSEGLGSTTATAADMATGESASAHA